MPERSLRPFLHRILAAAGALSFIAALVAVAGTIGEEALDCPPGMLPAEAEELPVTDRLAGIHAGPGEAELPGRCRPANLESFADLAARDLALGARSTAPFSTEPGGARFAAAGERQAMIDQGVTVRGSDGQASMWGQGPLNFDEDPYDSGQGIIDATGRIDDFFYDEGNDRLFAAVGTSGVWLSEDLGETWRSIGEGLPTNIASAVSWTPSGGPDGTVLVLTGEHTFGGGSFTGMGAFWSDDLGTTWTRAEGPPGETLAFALEVDPLDPDVVYAATGRGLWRSADAGRTYVDVTLPVGACEGDYNIETCNYAHFVTDVVIRTPGGVGPNPDGGGVMAAVGYRAGMLEDVSGDFIHSEGNGLYYSDTGEAGTFEKMPALDGAVGGAERLGRIELGLTVGEEQNHDVLFAIVQDAVLFNGGAQFDPLDAPNPLGANPTYLNGIYVSEDFGASWTQLADDREMSDVCPVNRSVYCIPGLIEPGAQSWYNMWIAPDPTRQVGGVPTRVVFGLEEVWQNRLTQIPANTPVTSFEVIGAYYGGVDCLLVATDCILSSNVDITTTHPDQHDGIWVPTRGEDGEPDGGVRLLVGHDGGISSQVLAPGDEATQQTWQLEQENGLDTLLPYSVAVANDGTAVAGLQDNGTMIILPEVDNRQFEVYGGDGTFAAIDPEDSSYAWGGVPSNSTVVVTSDRFVTTTDASPPVDNALFIPPFAMDPLSSDHVVTAGQQVAENLAGREATASTWSVVFDMGASEREPLVETEDPPPPRQASAIDTRGAASYVGYCSPCHILQSAYPFDSGIVTNVGAAELPEAGTAAGWHVAAAEGLPERYITSIAIDPYDPTAQTMYVTLGGYTRKWVPPGTGADEAEDVGDGHLFVSRDAGETFTDISGDLPDIPATWVEQRHDQLIVGTDIGPFISAGIGGHFAPLGGDGFPTVPVTGIQLQADDPDVAYLSVYGRGVMRYDFPEFTAGTVRRLAGPQREATAVAVSQDVYTAADTVVLARSDDYADALTGAPLAAAESAPLLLTPRTALADVAAQEITRLGASRVILLGGEAALGPEVEQAVRALGITDVTRVAGSNRFATAAAVADTLPGEVTDAWIVKGNDADPTRGWPDAMSIAPIAARAGEPILLVETDRLPQETVDALGRNGITDARIVGGTAAVSQGVADAVSQTVALGERVAGTNRFETSVAAAIEGLSRGHGVAQTWLARADDFADALSAGPSVAATGGTLLLVDRTGLAASGASADLLQRVACSIVELRLVGGEAALGTAVADDAQALLDACDGAIPEPPDQALVVVEPEPGETEGPGGTETLAGPFGFEEDAEGWTVSTSGNPTTPWARGDGGNGESATSFQVIPYGDLADTSLTSPELDSGGEPVFLTWAQTLDVEGGGFDEMAVEWSDDGGTTWTVAGSFGGRNAGFPEFSTQEVRFTPSGPFQVRFRMFADEICSSTSTPLCADTDGYEGVRVDDVEVRR